MKILYITPTSKISGAETGLCYILDNLTSQDEFVIVCPEGALVDRLKSRNVKIIPLKMYNFMFKKPYLYFLTIYKLYQLIKKEKPSIIHNNGVAVNQYGSIAARLAKVPCIVQCHTVEFFNKINALHLGLCNKIIPNSNFTADQLKKFLPNKSMEVVYGGVDLRKFKPLNQDVFKKKWKISKKTKVIGMIGMFLPRKGQHHFVEAAKIVKARFPDSLFVFVGSSVFTDASYENKIKQLCTEYNLKSLFTGFMNVEEIIPVFDVFCMPSINEAFGNVLNEVGAMAKPIVAFNSGGIPEIIEHNYNGLLVEPENINALAEAIIRILENPKLAKRLSENARKMVIKKFNAKRYANDLMKIYHSFV